MVQERYYKREFELLRSLQVSSSGPVDPVCYLDEDEDEKEDKAQRNEAYILLQKFQRLGNEQKMMVGKVHCNFSSYSKPWEVTRLLKTNKGNKIINVFYHYPSRRGPRYSSRQEKIREEIHYGSNIDL